MRVVREAGRRRTGIRTNLGVLEETRGGYVLDYPAEDSEVEICVPEEQG